RAARRGRTGGAGGSVSARGASPHRTPLHAHSRGPHAPLRSRGSLADARSRSRSRGLGRGVLGHEVEDAEAALALDQALATPYVVVDLRAHAHMTDGAAAVARLG